MLGEPILSQDVEITNLTHLDDNAIYEKYVTSVRDQMCAFIEGFAEFMPLPYIRIFTVDELQLVISGKKTIEVEDWKNNTTVYFKDDDKKLHVIRWFWNVSNELKLKDVGIEMIFFGLSQFVNIYI